MIFKFFMRNLFICKFIANPEGGFNFTCQHGPKECEGNLYQACVLSKTSDADKRMEFVNCFMTSLAATAVEVSAATLNVNRVSFRARTERHINSADRFCCSFLGRSGGTHRPYLNQNYRNPLMQHATEPCD